ncbi:MAG: hypothetical protein ACAF41_26915 [Leptolyngbya sp. BL-A-14]
MVRNGEANVTNVKAVVTNVEVAVKFAGAIVSCTTAENANGKRFLSLAKTQTTTSVHYVRAISG